jgi:hypothetical protein
MSKIRGLQPEKSLFLWLFLISTAFGRLEILVKTKPYFLVTTSYFWWPFFATKNKVIFSNIFLLAKNKKFLIFMRPGKIHQK